MVAETDDVGHPDVWIANVAVHDITFPETLALIDGWMTARSGGYICTPNVDYVVRARRDQAFRIAIGGARARVPDGMGIVYASRLAGRPLRGTVTGRLLVPAVARLAAARGVSVALYGGRPGVAARAAEALRGEIPNLSVTFAAGPPMAFEVASADADAEAEAIASARPGVVFVALGAPKQELWMERHVAHFDGTVLIGVGAAFDILAGRFREAPRWMTRVGLEWLFRLVQEPRRLARRYLIDDPWIFAWAAGTRLARVAARLSPP
jgi:N-acetylglucosaminyldiphosphoundecaprenol N-acetyl-beta-D-mannosaminyltransferase